MVAEKIFAEKNAVCEAIRWHTTGKAAMNTLEKIIYIADYMEPNRCFPGVEKLRALAYSDLDAAMFCGLDQSITLLRKQGRVIDPDSLAGWEYYGSLTERSQKA